MSERPATPVPVNLITGPLGVGKTTTINHLLRHRPADERWAVLVNEYGLVGLDAALMERGDDPDAPAGVEIREVAGGCICCSAGFMFEVSLVLLLQRRPDRLLIEPTGLASLSGILDTLDRPHIRKGVDVRTVVCLLEAGNLSLDLLREEVRDQIDAADVLLASRSDLASAEQLEHFNVWATELFPSKRFVGPIERGGIPKGLLDLVCSRKSQVPRRGYRHQADPHQTDPHQTSVHDHDLNLEHSVAEEHGDEEPCDEAHPIIHKRHQSHIASTFGWICWAGLLFDADRACSWLRTLTKLPGARRTKAVLRTTEGWLSFNFGGGIEEIRPSGHRRDSRLEVVVEGAELPDAEALEQDLRRSLMPPYNACERSSEAPEPCRIQSR
ncbi:MAG: GTP-binding protein [Myxococcota bacterium]